MSNQNDTSPEKSAWGYKGLIAAFLVAGAFLTFFYLAVTSEPDYMPSQQKKVEAQEAAKEKAEQQTTEAAK